MRSLAAGAVAAGAVVVGVVAAGVVGLAGCGEPAGAEQRTVTVLAAASLTETFTALARSYQAANAGVKVRLSFGASSTLAQQINQGAPADVFASASPTNLAQVKVAGTAVVFARNRLVIAVPKNNPKRIAGLADLARPGVKVAVCNDQVPCGVAARTALAAGGVAVTPVTREPDVKGALAKLRLGEVDAALVYRTDAGAASSEVDGVEFAESAKAVNDYPIAVLAGAPNPDGGRAFVAHITSSTGREALTAAGFQPP